MRLRNYIGVIGIVVFFGYLSTMVLFVPAGIIPIAFWEYPIFIIVAIVGFFLLNTIIEYGVLYDISRPYDVDKLKLLLSVTLVNLITFPVAHLAFYYALAFDIIFVQALWIVIEIIIIIIEWILYQSEFQKLLLDKPTGIIITSKTVFSISAIINTLSFLVIGIIDAYMMNAYFFFGARYF
ncbi:MAG: hypothetical protein ACFFCV_20550 [Promethearchaeota archaeon]